VLILLHEFFEMSVNRLGQRASNRALSPAVGEVVTAAS
jgi:hypothetical protein